MRLCGLLIELSRTEHALLVGEARRRSATGGVPLSVEALIAERVGADDGALLSEDGPLLIEVAIRKEDPAASTPLGSG